MGIHVSCCTAEFCRIGKLLKLTDLLFEACNEYVEFLAYASRRCRLAVSLCEHRDFCPVFSHSFDKTEDLLQKRHETLVDSFFE